MISELRQDNVGPTSQSCLEDIFVSLVCSHFLSCQLSFNFSVVPRSCHQRGPACYLWLLITYPVWLLVLRSWLRCLINSTDSNKHHLLSSSLSTIVVVSQDYLSGTQQGAGGREEGGRGELFCFAAISNQNYLEPRQLILQNLYRIYKKIFYQIFSTPSLFIWRKHERKSGIFLSPWDKYFIWKYNLI